LKYSFSTTFCGENPNDFAGQFFKRRLFQQAAKTDSERHLNFSPKSFFMRYDQSNRAAFSGPPQPSASPTNSAA
jgi:hypothetical protein